MEMEIERSDFVDAVSRLGDSVYSFHERFGLPTVAHEGEDVVLEALRRRLALLSEEVGEHARELNKGNVQDAVSEAVDIAYVALGTVLVLGNAGRERLLLDFGQERRQDPRYARQPGLHRQGRRPVAAGARWTARSA